MDPELDWAWRRITGSHGAYRIDALAAEVGWSRKRLWSRFGSQLGLPPKQAAKLVRFDHAAHRLVSGEVTAEASYADQSHLHRDVMAFTGATPRAVADELFLAVDDIAWPGRGTPPGLTSPSLSPAVLTAAVRGSSSRPRPRWRRPGSPSS